MKHGALMWLGSVLVDGHPIQCGSGLCPGKWKRTCAPYHGPSQEEE